MAVPSPSTVVPSAEARDQLSSYLKLFRKKGGQAEPVVFGSHRKPEGVILSYERYERQVEILDELVASEEVREALAADTGGRIEIAELARETGFDPAEFGL
jgi:antitoxin StbD